MNVDFICTMIAEMFGAPCNYSPIDEVVIDGDYCEKHCEKGSEAECWKRYFSVMWNMRGEKND